MRRLLALALPFSAALAVWIPSPVSSAVMAEDLATLERRLEDAPTDAKLLEACGLAALDDDQTDLGVWYLSLAIDAAPEDQELLGRVAIELATYEYPTAASEQLMTAYTETLFKVSKACSSKKLYANAVDLLLRCEGTRYEEGARERLEKIYEKQKAVEALLASGIDIPMQSESKLRPDDIARLDAKHSNWESAYEVEGEFYLVKTDMGYEMAHAMAGAMEQINTFYRKVFNYKQRGGSMRSCEIRVYKSRAEFDQYEEDIDQNVKGFYRPLDNNVTTYDPRTEESPGTLADLWSTLFHEASHQFTRAVWPNPIPTWLNEGTACYFEGTRIERGGSVSFNGIPDGRLRNLVALMDIGKPTVEDVITYFVPGSYDGEYYPFGWGLVYFLQNYEDESSERVYVPVFEDFMESYKSGGQHDVKERFVEYFVKKAKQTDVKTFEDFVARFEAWTKNLHHLHFGGKSVADELIARARKQLKDKQAEYAIESYKWALRKRPGDATILEELANLLANEKQSDAALYFYRQLAAVARGVSDPEGHAPGNSEVTAKELLARALAGVAKVDRTIAKNLGEADSAIVEGTLKLATSCAEAGLNRSALRFIRATQAVMSGDGALTDLENEIRTAMEGELGIDPDMRLWRRLHPEEDLTSWRASEEWAGKEGGVRVKADGMSLATYRSDLPARFRYEAAVEVQSHGEVWVYGLLFGSNSVSGELLYTVMPISDTIGVVQFVEGTPEFVETFEAELNGAATTAQLAIEVFPGRVDFYYDNEKVGSMEGGSELQGRVGLFVQDVEAKFSDLRLKY